MSLDELHVRVFVTIAFHGAFDDKSQGIHLKNMSHDLLYSLFQKHNITSLTNDDTETHEKLFKAISKEAEAMQSSSAA